MDDRQKQLLAAAEALRTWVHAQRAMWAQGYPQSLVQAHRPFASPPLVAAGADAASPSMFESDTTTSAPTFAWPEAAVSGRQWSRGLRDLVDVATQATVSAVGRSWHLAAAVVIIAVVGFTARAYWPGMRAKVASDLAASRQVVKAQTKALSQRVNSERVKAGVANADVKTIADPKTAGRLQIDSNPSGAHVLIDGHDRGVTPTTVDGLALGSHKVLIRGDEGSVQRTISIAPGESVQMNEAIYSGWLHVNAPIEVQISEGRNPITLDDSNQVLLAPGPHDVRFENRALGVREVRHVEIRPGETTAISLEAPTSHLTVTATEPSTVSVDGEPAGETPLTDFVVRVGTREVTVTNAAGDTHHETLTVTTRPAHIDVDFSKH
jgi:hypothetical protein